MNREENFGLREELIGFSQSLHLDSGEAGLPIVAMQHVNWFIEFSRQRHGRATEKSEAFEIVIVAVDLAAIEIVRRVDEISWSRQFIALPDANMRSLAAPKHAQCFIESLQPAAIDGIVEREDE